MKVVLTIAAIITVVNAGLFIAVRKEMEQGFNAGHQEATESIVKACADKGYFKVGILTYQCSQLFVVEE